MGFWGQTVPKIDSEQLFSFTSGEVLEIETPPSQFLKAEKLPFQYQNEKIFFEKNGSNGRVFINLGDQSPSHRV
jgi:hypothetical protein